MQTPGAIGPADNQSRVRVGLGLLFVGVAFLGHLLAARAIGGTYVAYRDHLLGFVGILLVSGALTLAAGRRFWRDRPGMRVLASGIVQALGGVFAYVTRFHVHG
ncbi:hypothetical protein tb265_41070 [Gemmatimonadetes bacterium T265]|nr:hypothetical protein tb265_41070 [Gemmatimonadetes bacterium T265]